MYYFFHISGKEEHLTAQAALRDNPDREGTNHAPFVVTTETDSKYCYCPFCDKSQEKLPRHCKMLHAEEVLVAKASSISKDHVQDIREEWRKIRNMGNHKHNTLVFQGEASDLVVQKRPTDNQDKRHKIFSYVPCGDCLGYYHKDSLWIHKKSAK